MGVQPAEPVASLLRVRVLERQAGVSTPLLAGVWTPLAVKAESGVAQYNGTECATSGHARHLDPESSSPNDDQTTGSADVFLLDVDATNDSSQYIYLHQRTSTCSPPVFHRSLPALHLRSTASHQQHRA
jgi:hypothetical protein